MSKQSRTDDPSWSVSASFLDYDRDGWLDLFVGNYLSWRVESSTPCFSPSGRPDYCSPNVYQPQPSRLYHNNRDGTFTDVTAAAGIAREFGPALGVSTADFNGDGWIDIYVANDGQPNQLWINQHDGTFKNMGLLSGTALSAHGKAKAGMGVDAGDIDNDGDEDLFVTNLTGEGNDLYVNDGSGLFEEQSARSGLGAASRGYTGFGTAWFDVDNDGWLDTLIVNGAVQTIEALRRVNDPFPLHQRKLLFRNLGAATGACDSRMSPRVAARRSSCRKSAAAPRSATSTTTATSTCWSPTTTASRGCSSTTSAAATIGSDFGSSGKQAPRDMLGARVGIVRDDGSTLWRRARSDGSYASANDPRVLVGLGQSTHVSSDTSGVAERYDRGVERRRRSIGTPRSKKATASDAAALRLASASAPALRDGRSSSLAGRLSLRNRGLASTSSAARRAESDISTLPPVALPDLSRMEKSVQQQMSERYRLLTSMIENRGTPPLDLAQRVRRHGQPPDGR